MNLSVQLTPRHQRGLLLANPVMTASGTFGYGTEYSHLFDIQRLGAIVCKGTTLKPREGNPQPRLAETASGLLNSIGLQNIGVKALVKEKAPLWAQWCVPVIVNIAGQTIDEYAQVAGELDGVAGISAIEVNVSCPNITAGGAEFGKDPEPAAKVPEDQDEAGKGSLKTILPVALVVILIGGGGFAIYQFIKPKLSKGPTTKVVSQPDTTDTCSVLDQPIVSPQLEPVVTPPDEVSGQGQQPTGSTLIYDNLPFYPNITENDRYLTEGDGVRAAYETPMGISSKEVLDYYEAEKRDL